MIQSKVDRPIRAVLFDLDDTLIAFDAVTEKSWRQVCSEHESHAGSITGTSLAAEIRVHSEWFWSDPERHRSGRLNLIDARRTIVTRAFAALGLHESDAITLADRYSQVRFDNIHLLEGASEVLARLAARDIPLVLVTNGDSAGQREKIRRFDLARYFRAILVEGELGFGKPDPRVYETALGFLGIDASEVCMVGDNLTWDVGAPQQAGIRGVWIDRKSEGVPRDGGVTPWRVVRRISEVDAVLSNAPEM